MQIPLSLLRLFFEDRLDSISPQEIGERLTLLGIELESIEGVDFSFQNVVVARVEATNPHPNADKLCVAEVFDGEQKVQVVCGASNCRPGIVIPFARIGAELRSPEGIFQIKKAKLRGVESFGMLCSQDELGLTVTIDGLYELPSDAPLGMDLRDFLSDPIFVVGLTPNLGHCMSVIGVARELAASLGCKIVPLPCPIQESQKPNSLTVQIDTPACKSIAFRVLENVHISSSPAWLQSALEKLGQRTHNLAVDISNYVMFMLGQPLHMYDLDKFQSSCISVRDSSTWVSGHAAVFHGLNDKSYMIPTHSLVIECEDHLLGLAGLMGGFSSRVTEKTTRIAIEAACFDPSFVRSMSKHLQLRTESSARFEKGTDPAMISSALDIAAMLLQQCGHPCGVEILKGVVSATRLSSGNLHPSKHTISLRPQRVNRLLGSKLSSTEIRELLQRLDIESKEDNNSLLCSIPTWRNDLKEEIDLVEEVARLYGFNNLRKLESSHLSSLLPDDPIYQVQTSAMNTLIEIGLQQCITCDLISPRMSELTLEKHFPSPQVIEVLHPSSSDQSILRVSLLPGLLDVIHRNLLQGTKDLALFEVGRTHINENGLYQEPEMAAICLTGLRAPHYFAPKPGLTDFYDLKGMAEELIHRMTGQKAKYEESHLSTFHPFQQAKIFLGNDMIGVMGQVHPTLLQGFDIDVPVFFAELNLLKLRHHHQPFLKMEPLGSFPGIVRDWTVCIPKGTSSHKLLEFLEKKISSPLRSFIVWDLFAPSHEPHQKLTLRFFYRREDRTLQTEEVETFHESLKNECLSSFQDITTG